MSNLGIKPLNQIESIESRDPQRRAWRSTGADPQLQLLVDGQGFLRGGWYYLLLDVRAEAEIHVVPVVYTDYGSGLREDDRIELRVVPGVPDCYESLIRLRRTVHLFRLDPGEGRGEFTTGTMVVRRLSRPAALVTMMVSLMRRRRGKRAKLGTLKRALLQLLRGGLGGLGGAMYAEYSAASTSDSNDDYERWVRLYGIGLRSANAAQLEGGPLISVVMPVYNTPEKWLRRSIQSVLDQYYPHWQLCIADDASTVPYVRRVLEEFAAADSRIKIAFRERNGNIAAASNTALQLASGRYLALLDHDDELDARALEEIAAALSAHPQWRMVYSDEDKIDEEGRRYDPYFKPDWNYELFLSQNCFCHLGIFDMQLVRDVGGFREGLEGSQDWDLALRCSERLSPEQIGHLPKVIYHWRAIPGSTALSVGEKSYAVTAGQRAVAEHLQRIGVDAKVLITDWGHYRVRYAVPSPPLLVSLIIPTRDNVGMLKMCVGSILNRTAYSNFEILIVDNQSVEPETVEYFARIVADPRVRVLHFDAPFNYSAINNFAAAQARGDILGLVNNDIEVISPDWLDEMVGHAARPQVGAVGAMLYYPNDTIQHAGVIVGQGGVAGHAYLGKPRGYAGQMNRARLTQSLSAVTAACLLVRRQVYEAVGGLDEALKVAFNDIDFCLRVRKAGYRNVWTSHAELYHHESATRGPEDTPEKIARFNLETAFMRDRWGQLLLNDPAYNLNLALDRELFTLAFPPRTAG